MNCPGFYPSILWRSGIWRAADEAAFWISYIKKEKIQDLLPLQKNSDRLLPLQRLQTCCGCSDTPTPRCFPTDFKFAAIAATCQNQAPSLVRLQILYILDDCSYRLFSWYLLFLPEMSLYHMFSREVLTHELKEVVKANSWCHTPYARFTWINKLFL